MSCICKRGKCEYTYIYTMKKSKRFQCPICEFTCGKNAGFLLHLESHGYTSIETAYVDLQLKGKRPSCRCGCGQSTHFAGWSKGFAAFIKGHNANIYTSYEPETAQKIISQRSAALIGKVGWSRGRTKESDKRIAQAAETRSKTVTRQFKTGERTPWSKGLTHLSDDRIAKHREALIEGFRTGAYTPWAKGQTKATDERIATMALNVARTMTQKEVRDRLDSLKRLSDAEIIRRLADVPNIKLAGGLEDYRSGKDRCLQIECNSCGLIQKKSLIEAMTGRCGACSPAGSQAQIEIDRYVRSCGFTTHISSRDVIPPYEIDTHVPDVKLGIEYNGLYFHSAIFKNKKYHSQKTELCAAADITLMHIFEDEWRDKQGIIKSMISHRLGAAHRKIGARNCQIMSISKDDRRNFFEKNHIDGDVKSSLHAALVDSAGDIVACMSLRRPLHKKYKNSLEVARFCTALYTSVPGALGRLTKWAIERAKQEGYTGLITYVDTRHGTGKGYKASGWHHTGSTPDRFWWTDGRHRIDRFKIRADKAAGLSESDVAAEHGVVKIWGCPNLVFEIKIA